MLHTSSDERGIIREAHLGRPAEMNGATIGLYVANLGRFESRGRFRCTQISTSVAVHVVSGGQGVVHADGRKYTVGAGDLFVFFPGQHLTYRDRPETPWRYVWVVLAGALAQEALQHCGLDPAHPHRTGGIAERLDPVLLEAEKDLSEAEASPATASYLAWRLIKDLEPVRTPAPRPGLVERARFILHHHYGEPLTVEDIAARLGVSRTTLFRAFRKSCGQSPKEVFDGIRMDQAMHLLRSSGESLKEIAAACGYASEAYFSRAFKARSGLPPGAWRNRQDAVDRREL